MGIGKDKVYHYYKLFKEGIKSLEIYQQYKANKSKYGRKKKVFSEYKLDVNHTTPNRGGGFLGNQS